MIKDYCLHCCKERGRTGGCKICGPKAPGIDVAVNRRFLPPGIVLRGQYIVGRELGHGGFGVTYLGVDKFLGFRVAIKEHFPWQLAVRDFDGIAARPLSDDTSALFKDGLRMFLEEGRNIALLRDHPNIVTVTNFFEENGTGYLVMDYVDGLSLENLVIQRGGLLPEKEAIQIIMALLDGLRAVHDKNLLHRDIKPANIYIANEGSVKLLDFGAARCSLAGRTGEITHVWTPGFAPPEQCNSDGRQGTYTDIYAVGATLYVILTGQLIPDAEERSVSNDLIIKSPRDIMGEAVSINVSAAVMKCLELDYKERFQSVQELQKAITEKQQNPLSTGSYRNQPGQPNQNNQPVQNKQQSQPNIETVSDVTGSDGRIFLMVGFFSALLAMFGKSLFFSDLLPYGIELLTFIFSLVLGIFGIFGIVTGLWKLNSQRKKISESLPVIIVPPYKEENVLPSAVVKKEPVLQEVISKEEHVLQGVEGPYAGNEIPIENACISIGRDPAVCAVVIPQEFGTVSRCHVEIKKETGGQIVVKDCRSRHGTYLGNKAIPSGEWVRLPFGKELVLGNRNVSFVIKKKKA